MNISILINSLVKGFKCPRCGYSGPIDIHNIICPRCGAFFEIEYKYDELYGALIDWSKERRLNVWAYSSLLPCSSSLSIVSLGEGGTPLVESRHLVNGVDIFLKNEATNPTGSFLDRGATVLVSMIKEFHNLMSCAINANLAISLAAYGAKSGIRVKFFCSPEVDRGEFYQAIALGADISVSSSQRKALIDALSVRGAYYVDSANPFLLEGEKTIAFEILEELSWNPPLWIIIPVGTGGLLSMIWKGIKELKMVGLIKGRLPKLVAVQAEAFSPLVDLFDGSYNRRPNETLAKDLIFFDPPKLIEAYNAIRESKGIAIRVNDEEIVTAIKDLALNEGILAGPAAASTIAAARKLRSEGIIDKGDSVVCIISGSGLKDPEIIRIMIRQRERKYQYLSKSKLYILQTLRYLGGKSYGYAIAKALKEYFSIELSLPTIYHHLKEMEAMGLVRRLSIINKRIILYEITRKGMALLKEHNFST